MMGLPVNIVGDSSADSDEFCSRTDHRQPSLWTKHRNDLFKADTCLAFQYSFLPVEIEKMVQFRADGNIMVVVDGLVTITPAKSPGDQRRLFQLRSQVLLDSRK